MRKIYVLMAAAALLTLAACGNTNNNKKSAEAEEAAVQEAEAVTADKAQAAGEEELEAREAIDKISAEEVGGEVESIEETLKKNPDYAIPFAKVEQKPTFNGGDPGTEFSKWVNSQVKYPESAVQGHVEGRVVLQFNVNKAGEVKDVTVLKGVDPALDAEAVRVVSSSPKWTSGTQCGIPVNVKYVFPLVFKIQNQ